MDMIANNNQNWGDIEIPTVNTTARVQGNRTLPSMKQQLTTIENMLHNFMFGS